MTSVTFEKKGILADISETIAQHSQIFSLRRHQISIALGTPFQPPKPLSCFVASFFKIWT